MSLPLSQLVPWENRSFLVSFQGDRELRATPWRMWNVIGAWQSLDAMGVRNDGDPDHQG